MAPTARLWQESSQLYERLRGYYFGKKADEAPLISERTAFACAGIFTLLIVAPFYLSPTLRSSPLNSRDSPTVIKARIRAVGLTSAASTALTVFVLAFYGHATPRDTLRLLGIWPIDPLDCLKVLALVAILFSGPLYEALIVEGGWRECNLRGLKEHWFDSWIAWRNNIIAPLSEELVFRSLVISLCLLAKVSPTRIVFITPLIFGAAHVHHFSEFVQSRTPQGRILPPLVVVLTGLARSIFQFAFTSVFGFFAAFVFLRTGNVFAAIFAHSFCNHMGFPRLWGSVGQFDDLQNHHTTPDVAQGKRTDAANGSNSRVRVGNGSMRVVSENDKRATGLPPSRHTNLGIMWTAVYYALLLAGVFGFYRLLWTLTESVNALARF